MEHDAGLQISLLDGMDEELLLRLHGQGIRSREELQDLLSDPERRHGLADRLRVPVLRLEAIHHLNFVLPEERVARLLRLERRLSERVEDERRERRVLWRAVFGLAAAVFAIAVLVLVLGRTPSAGPVDRRGDGDLRSAVAALEERVAALLPLARRQSESELLEALAGLGPAPGWPGPLAWTLEDDRRFAAALGDAEGFEPNRAVSVALSRLQAIEQPDRGTPGVLPRASEAARFLQDFPQVENLDTVWDAAAALIRLRLQSRALGAGNLDDSPAAGFTSVPWPWTAPGFVRAELLLSRVEALPIHPEVYAVWSETVAALRGEVDAARSALGSRSEAWAREYWIRRAELEIAVVAAMLENGTLLPYHQSAPGRFLAQRRGFLEKAISRAPRSAQDPLRWLLVEYAEAQRFVEWIGENETARESVIGKRWGEAIADVETRRVRSGDLSVDGLEPLIRSALNDAGSPAEDVWASERLCYEAGLRPMLIATRTGIEAPAPPASSPGSSAATQ